MEWNGCVPDPEHSLHDFPMIARLLVMLNITIVLWGAISVLHTVKVHKDRTE